MAVLVTGGAGYIGSVTVERLCQDGVETVVVDNLVRGHRAAVPPYVAFYRIDIRDTGALTAVVRKHRIRACIHFAALAYVDESVRKPAEYYSTNVVGGLALLNTLLENGVDQFVLSSTCATYGVASTCKLAEEHPQRPINPYGRSKLAFELALRSYADAYPLRYVALRYFNAGGATVRCGEDHRPETHLIPSAIDAVLGRREELVVYGESYSTEDGTAVRDYVHVADLADAHVRALNYLSSGGVSAFLNLGSGHGCSVRSVVATVGGVAGVPVPVRFETPRPGDPPSLVADAARAGKVLGWSPANSSIEQIVESAWAWRLAHPDGYDHLRLD